MFTGLVSYLGNVKSIELNGDSAKLIITNPAITKEIKAGDSVAVNGVCLTVTEFDSSPLM
jgi:riboflavin synthase